MNVIVEQSMKILITLFFFVSIYSVYSDAEAEHKAAKAAFMRYMKSAHPLPETIKKPTGMDVLFSKQSSLPNFLNVDATMDEEAAEPNKMQNESSIAVNPKNPKNLIASAVDYRANSSTWVYVSSDGGISWKNLNLGKPYPNWRSTNDPSVYFDNEGIGYLCYGGFGDVLNSEAGLVGENGVFIAKTTDEGKTWKAHIPVIIHLGNQTMDSTFEDKYYVQVDNSIESPYHRHIYVPWKRVTPRDSATQIVISKSVDLGETWSAPVNISYRIAGSSEDTTFGQSFPLASTGPRGELYVVWNHGLEHSVGFSKSYDGGKTFSEPRLIQKYNIFGETKFLSGQGYRHTVKGTVRAEAYPVIITDITNVPRRGNLYLCWTADNYPNVYFSKSTDEGETWSTPVIVHSDTTNDQFWQWMSIDPLTGDLSIMYLDSRNDINNIMIECYVSYSSDGGDTWIDRRVSDINSDIRLNPFANRAFAGDYSGSAFYDGIIYPSWVDMRNAVTNLADSDVFTAVVNTRAPEPPVDFVNTSDYTIPSEVTLSWVPPNKRAFGQELKPEEFVQKIVKNNEIIAELDGFSTEYIDNNVTPFEKYNYSIYAVAGKDSSIARELIAYPGGSGKPDYPIISEIAGNLENSVYLDIKLPSFRSDKITPLANLNGIKVLRNGNLSKEVSLNSTDTAKTIKVEDVAPSIGFFFYKSYITDYFDKLNITTTSDFSPEINVFTGSYLETLVENFDNSPLPYYYSTMNWKLTNEVAVSGNNSYTNAPNGKYLASQFDTLIFLPVKFTDNEDLYMTFMQICSVFPDDSAFVEISYDDLKSWEHLSHFNNSMNQSWRDNEINNQDWQLERLTIPFRENSSRIFVRLRFWSNLLRQGDGWYIDDVVIGDRASFVSSNDNHTNIKLFPNPTSDFVKIVSGIGTFSRVKIFNIHGQLITEYISDNSSDVTINTSNFPSGAYHVEIENERGIKTNKVLFISN